MKRAFILYKRVHKITLGALTCTKRHIIETKGHILKKKVELEQEGKLVHKKEPLQ